MKDVRLSIVIPTIGRPCLSRVLRSVLDAGFDREADEVVVVSDGPSPDAQKILKFYESTIPARFFEGPVSRMVGQVQKNLGISKATGTHILVMDDDDQYVPDCFEHVRARIRQAPDRLHLFKMLACDPRHSYGHCWRSRDIVVGNVGTPMLVAPNVPGHLGQFGNHYCGDYDYVRSTVDLHPDRENGLSWVDHVIAYIY